MANAAKYSAKRTTGVGLWAAGRRAEKADTAPALPTCPSATDPGRLPARLQSITRTGEQHRGQEKAHYDHTLLHTHPPRDARGLP
jgi:hypothetical protein